MSVLMGFPIPVIVKAKGPRVHSIISMPPEVWDFELTYLRTPPTDVGYQKAIRAIAQTVAQSYSPRRQDIIYNQLMLLQGWRPQPQRGKSGRPPTYSTREELMGVLVLAMRRMTTDQRYGSKITKSAVAKEIGTTYRQLQAWLKKWSLDFEQVTHP